MEGVHEVARFITVYGTPGCLGLIASYLVFAAFEQSFAAGLRSLAGTLLPVVIASFLYVFRRGALEQVAGLSTFIGFAGGRGMGLLAMGALRFLRHSAALPLPELVVSGCFSVLVFSSAAGQEDRGLAWYYGVMCGLLVYLVFWGLPMPK